MKFDSNNALGLASVAIGLVGLYLAWRFFSDLKKGADSLGNTIGDAVADLVVDNSITVISGAVLPTGERVSFKQIVGAGSSLKYVSESLYTFDWKGVRYYTSPPRRQDGYLNARRSQ